MRVVKKRLGAIDTLLVPLDRASGTLLQRQVEDALRSAIASGALRPGTRLPSTRALAAELGVSRTTAVAATQELVAEGYLVARARSGTFVARRPPLPDVAPRTRAPKGGALGLSRRAALLADEAGRSPAKPRPRPFALSRPALDAFPVREWSRILSRRAARVSISQLDYGTESPELRGAVADLVSSSRGSRVHEDQVLIFGGSQRALEFACAAVLDPGDRAWIEEPAYHGARSVLLAAGASLVHVPVDGEGIDVAAGEAMAAGARLAYVTPSSQFPLGVTMSVERRRALLRWADAAGACVVEDDYDCEFRHGGAPVPALHALDASGRVLYVNSFSRTMFPDIRLGYLVAPAALVDALRRVRAGMDEALPMMAQLALADFIAEGHFVRHLRRMRVLYGRRREALITAARSLGVGHVRAYRASAGLHVVVDLPDAIDAVEVSRAAAARGVEVVALEHFSARPAACPPALVLGFGAVGVDRARAGMEKLALAIDDVRRRAKGSRPRAPR